MIFCTEYKKHPTKEQTLEKIRKEKQTIYLRQFSRSIALGKCVNNLAESLRAVATGLSYHNVFIRISMYDFGP